MYALLLTLGICAPPAFEQRLADVETDIGNLEPKLKLILAQYTKTEEVERKASVDKRITDGEILHLLGDHMRAGIVLYDVVEDPKNASHPLYDQALYYLAESNFQIRNFAGARIYFRRLIQRRGAHYLFEGFQRLIEIADMLEDYTGIEAQVAELRAAGAGTLRPDVAYFYGKSLARRARDHAKLDAGVAAITHLLTIPRDHKYYARARYIIGAELVRQRRLDDALKEFRHILTVQNPAGLGAPAAEHVTLRELAAMGIARIHAERGALIKALDAYQGVSRQSRYLPQALYEIAWLYVSQSGRAKDEHERNALLRKSLQALDILLLTPDEQALLPAAQVLKGNVLLKLGRFLHASEAFREVNTIYEPVHKQLVNMIRDQKEPERYFNEIIAKNQGTYDAKAFLPPLAVRWATGEHEVGQALGVANDLLGSQGSIAEAKTIGEKLTSALERRRAIELFPILKEGEDKGFAIEIAEVGCFTRILDLLRERSAPRIAGPEQSTLQNVTARRLAAQKQYLALGTQRTQGNEREVRRLTALANTEKDALHLRVALAGTRAQLVAVAKWVDDNKAAGRLNDEDANTMQARVKEEAAALTKLEDEQRGLAAALGREKDAGGGGALTNEERVRENYANAVREEMDILQRAAGRLGSAAQNDIRRIVRVRDRLAGMDANLRDFRARVNTLVDRKAAEIAAAVQNEMRLLAGYERELASYDGQAKQLVGRVAYDAFDDVRSKFYQLVLKADVGLIDVAWREKDEETESINGLVRAQKAAVQQLDDDFHEALQEGTR